MAFSTGGVNGEKHSVMILLKSGFIVFDVFFFGCTERRAVPGYEVSWVGV